MIKQVLHLDLDSKTGNVVKVIESARMEISEDEAN